MYEILFCRGCYGHYIASSVYYYTNLNLDSSLVNLKDFVFTNGSSHAMRDLDQFRSHDGTKDKLIRLTHLREDIKSKNPITIQPCSNCHLDYLINVLVKQHGNDYNDHVTGMIGDAIVEKYKKLYNGTSDKVPNWVQREILSFMISDLFTVGYNPDDYVMLDLPQSYTIKTSDIFSNFMNTLDLLIDHWELEKLVSNDIIIDKHNEFLETQRYHTIQYKVEKFCQSILSGTDTNYQFVNLYDEAYLQHLLRENGYELKCHELNDLPSVSSEFETLIYKV